MSFPRRHHFNNHHKKRPDRPHSDRPHSDRSRRHQDDNDPARPDQTGAESAYLKSLVDSHAEVTVVMTDGERLHGFIRYYDRYCFSVGLSAEGPKIFLRKASVSYIAEE
jgi:sRNA-binding regulator protein Hfq